MGVYIDMKMPKYCYDCPLHNGESGYCQADNEHWGQLERPESCPLIELPKHGKLIDGDALKKVYDPSTAFGKAIRSMIDCMPVFIESEE